MLLRKTNYPRPLISRDAVPQPPLTNGACPSMNSGGHSGGATQGIDDFGEGVHASRTIRHVTAQYNTRCNALPATLQSVTSQGDRLRILAKLAGFPSLADFARAAGLEPGTARQQANRNSIPAEALGKYIATAKGTGATMEWLASELGPAPRGIPESAIPLPRTRVSPEPPTSGRPDVPVWASAEAGNDGAMILVPDPIDYIYRSERMLGVRNPFAFVVVGNSMSPAVEHGDQVVINPALKPRPNVDCVFVQRQEDGSFLALVKRLLRATESVWKVRQFEPKRDFELSRKEWSQAHVIAEIRRGGL